jgi:membrane-bound ClpP family serine protease
MDIRARKASLGNLTAKPAPRDIRPSNMDNSTFAILLLVVSLVLLVAEVFIPSGGMILITAIVCLVASVWFAWRAWADYPAAWWTYIASVIILIPSAVGSLLYWFPKTSMGKRILLEAPTLEEVTAYDDEAARLRKLVGEKGETLTLLNPGGIVMVAGERHHCESEGLMIEPRESVEVVRVSGNRLVVRPATRRDDPDAGPSAPHAGDRSDDRSLDFEVPYG